MTDASTYAYDCPELPSAVRDWDVPITNPPWSLSRLIKLVGPCSRCGMPGAEGSIHICPAEYEQELALLRALADAACTYYVTSGGQGGDALMRAARQVYEMRQENR